MSYMKKIQNSIIYIEGNLEENISLSDLAEQAFFSDFHFHRLFQSATGETVMEYVRKRRLAAAARELIGSDRRIIDIALQYHFSSQDTFCRAFQRLYGITPGKYRELENQPDAIKKFEAPKEAYGMYDWNTGQRLSCSEQEKADSLELFDTMLRLSDKVRAHGILALEDSVPEASPFLLRKGLQLVIDGTHPAAIREILGNYIVAGTYSGKELLIRVLILEGLLSIQAGESSVLLRERLSAFFGEAYGETIERHFGIDAESMNDRLKEYYKKIADKPPFASSTALLENPLQKLDDRSLQRLLREIDIVDLVKALRGASGKLQGRLLENMSKKAAVYMMEELEGQRLPEVQQLIESQNRVLEIMRRLRAEGDIV